MSTPLPEKTSEQQWAVWDSTRLNDFPFRDDDIMIATWSKSGTTWMQQLAAQLVSQGDPSQYSCYEGSRRPGNPRRTFLGYFF